MLKYNIFIWVRNIFQREKVFIFIFNIPFILTKKVPYHVIKDYSGTWCPCRLGCRVLFDCPWSDEPRLRVKQGDTLHVTRHKK